jgi:hypothetical protein
MDYGGVIEARSDSSLIHKDSHAEGDSYGEVDWFLRADEHPHSVEREIGAMRKGN